MSELRDKNTASTKLTFGMLRIYLFGNDEAHIEIGDPASAAGVISMECRLSELRAFVNATLVPALERIAK